MRAAQIDSNGFVINIAEVSSLNNEFINPMSCEIGDYWDGASFAAHAPQPFVTPTEIQYIQAIQAWMDGVAQSQKFLSMDSAVTFADEPASPSLQAKGQKLRAWRSQCWDYAHNVELQASSGKRAWPTLDGIIAELPAYVP